MTPEAQKVPKPSAESRVFPFGAPGIPGYSMHSPELRPSPISLEEFELMKKSALFTDEDIRYLRMSKDVLKPHVEEIVSGWYDFIGSQPHLLQYFARVSDFQPDSGYLEAVKKRFMQWVMDTADAQYDQDWLNYQYEIGCRHHVTGKNKTDQALSVPVIHYRYIPSLVYPVVFTMKPYLAKSGKPADDVEKMHQAWLKSVLLQTILWAQPYVKEGQF